MANELIKCFNSWYSKAKIQITKQYYNIIIGDIGWA